MPALRRLLSAAAAVFAALLLAPHSAAAQESAPAAGPSPTGAAGQNEPNAQSTGQAFADPSQVFSGQPGALLGAGLGKLDGDVYARTIIHTDFSFGQVGLGLALPLDILVANTGPGTRDEKTYGGYIRKRDWNDPQDLVRLIRYLRYGRKRDQVYFLAGEHWGSSIGHGTLVNRYANTLQIDHPKLGLALDVNTDFFGFETLTDHVLAPTLLAGRAYVRPFGDTLGLRGWALGVTFADDRTAPRALAYDPTSGAILQDDQGNPSIADSHEFHAIGFDTEYQLVHTSLLDLIPYVDLNHLYLGGNGSSSGNGLHAGILTNLLLPIPVIDLNVQARLEYRIMQPGYLPEYFDQTYDLGRVQYAEQTSLGTRYVPKVQAAVDARAAGGDNIKGYYGELALGFAGLIQVGGLLSDYDGANGTSLGLFATVPKLEVIKLSGYYLRKNFNGLADSFTIDERSLLGGSAAYKMFGPVYLKADYRRQWVLNPGDKKIKAFDNFSVGIATYIPF